VKKTLSVLIPLFATAVVAAGPAQAPKKTAKSSERLAAVAPGGESPVKAENLKGFHWRAIGPANMGGRVSDIAGHPSDPATFYIALGTGGLLKTANYGTTWTFIFEEQAVASVGSVAVATSQPEVVWVGTGEGNSRNSSSWGNGVYRSTDAGKTWQHLGLAETHDIPRLVVHPKDPDTAYVCAHQWLVHQS